MTKPLKLKLVDGTEKEVLNKTYTSRELNAFVEGKHIVSDLDNDPFLIKTNKLAKVANMIFKMENLATLYLHIICLVLKILHYLNQQRPDIRNSNMVILFP